MITAFERHASRRGAHFAQTDPHYNKGFRRLWEDPPFVQIGVAVDAVTRKLSVEACLRLIQRAEACDRSQDRRQLVVAAAQILREAGLTPADLTRSQAS